MPTKLQIKNNLKLSEKLLDYLSKYPRNNKQGNISYIIITKEDSELNKENLVMAESLVREGKNVVKAIETNNRSTPWKFASL